MSQDLRAALTEFAYEEIGPDAVKMLHVLWPVIAAANISGCSDEVRLSRIDIALKELREKLKGGE